MRQRCTSLRHDTAAIRTVAMQAPERNQVKLPEELQGSGWSCAQLLQVLPAHAAAEAPAAVPPARGDLQKHLPQATLKVEWEPHKGADWSREVEAGGCIGLLDTRHPASMCWHLQHSATYLACKVHLISCAVPFYPQELENSTEGLANLLSQTSLVVKAAR